MSRILVFAGTTEGRELCEFLLSRGAGVTACVVSGYGRELLPSGTDIREGRLELSAMEMLMAEGFDAVVDATHPHAAQVTGHIRRAAETIGLVYYRLLRPSQETEGCRVVSSEKEAAALLRETSGPIMTATGSKNLPAFTAIADYPERVYPRVLPTAEAVSACLGLGFRQSHIIAMQGPFSRAMNEAVLEQFGIRYLVTKESGREGGFAEKLAAARSQGTELIVIRRPLGEAGYTLEELKKILQKGLEKA